jgi:hypothetical protein
MPVAADVLTPDNPHLSRLRLEVCEPVMAFPIDWNSPESMPRDDAFPPDRVVDLIAISIAAYPRAGFIN